MTETFPAMDVDTYISTELARMFRSPRRSPRSRALRGCTTHDLAKLKQDIVSHWEQLSDVVKEEVKRYFKVDETNDPIQIGLI